MALSERDREILAEIEADQMAHDPEFAQAMTGAGVPLRFWVGLSVAIVFAGGLVSGLAFTTVLPWLTLVGVPIAAGGAVLLHHMIRRAFFT